MKAQSEEFYPSALTIAGSDSGGGAGVQADLRTFNTAGVFGCSVITALTAQNPAEVRAVALTDPAMVRAQLCAVLDRIAIRAAKTGMLGNGDIVVAVAEELRRRSNLPLVVDPVMVSTSGKRLLEDSGMEAMREALLPLADWITPNLPEAEWLLGRKLESENACADAAAELGMRYQANVILKGGHSLQPTSRLACDTVYVDGELYLLQSPRCADLSEFAPHGTGCTMSAALTAAIALNHPWKTALCEVKSLIYGSLCEVAEIGRGLEAMYPPLEDYSEMVALKKISGAETSAGGSPKRDRKIRQ